MYISMFKSIVDNLADYIRKCNLKSMVLGLSGGIDSTLCALICNDALKQLPDVKLFLISLPSNTNGHDENDIAIKLGDGLMEMNKNVYFALYNIEKEADTMISSAQQTLNTFSTQLSMEMQPIHKGNIKARLRMMYLYNIASVNQGVVIDTDNLTEHYLGFWTIHGDVGDVNPTGRLWKTGVYEMANLCLENLELNDKVKEALQASIDITPTDGNGVKAGGDLAQIAPGLTYQDVDEILRNEVLPDSDPDNRQDDVRERLREKYGRELVDGVIRRHKNSEFKRNHMPKVIMNF